MRTTINVRWLDCHRRQARASKTRTVTTNVASGDSITPVEIKLDENSSNNRVVGNAKLLTTPSQVQARHRLGSPNSRHPLFSIITAFLLSSMLFTATRIHYAV